MKKLGIIFNWLDSHSSSIVAIATVLLAIFTSLYLYEAHRMRVETRNLVELTKTQFMIKSFPTFLVDKLETKKTGDILENKYRINNVGEISAHDVSIVNIDVLKKKGEKSFIFKTSSAEFYDGFYRSDALEYQIKIPPNVSRTLEDKVVMEKEYDPDTLYKIIYIRFKVPYDSNYRYETFAYILEKDLDTNDGNTDKIKFRWEMLTNKEKRHIIERHMETQVNPSIGYNKTKLVPFFIDFEPLKNANLDDKSK